MAEAQRPILTGAGHDYQRFDLPEGIDKVGRISHKTTLNLNETDYAAVCYIEPDILLDNVGALIADLKRDNMIKVEGRKTCLPYNGVVYIPHDCYSFLPIWRDVMGKPWVTDELALQAALSGFFWRRLTSLGVEMGSANRHCVGFKAKFDAFPSYAAILLNERKATIEAIKAATKAAESAQEAVSKMAAKGDPKTPAKQAVAK